MFFERKEVFFFFTETPSISLVITNDYVIQEFNEMMVQKSHNKWLVDFINPKLKNLMIFRSGQQWITTHINVVYINHFDK